jgi:hypothetical protein
MMTQYTSGNSVFLEVRELSLYPKSLTKPKTAVMLARMPSQLSPNGFIMAAHSAARSIEAQACSRIASPPLSLIAYSVMTDRHSLAPASRRVVGSSVPVDAGCETKVSDDSCDLAMNYLARMFCSILA